MTRRPGRRPLHHAVVALLLGGLVLATGGAQGRQDREDAAADLERLRAQIAAMRERLAETRGRYGNTETELRKIEARIGDVSSALRRTDDELRTRERRLSRLQDSERELAAGVKQQRAALARQVRASYAMGRQEQLKILLNQGDPATVGRALIYYDYLNRSRTARIRAAVEQLERLKRMRTEIAEERAELESLRRKQLAQKESLEDSRSARGEVLAALSAQIQGDDAQLRNLLQGERELQEVLRTLEQALSDIPTDMGAGRAFGELKGKLPWPVAGRVLSGYGSPRAGGKLRWRGVVIGAERGSEVQAVSHGRVAFAEWMRGYGLLLIVDHGDGFMSLYGHNQSIYKDVGEWVQGGEVVASVGESGGRADSGLYFEIRRHGEPVNPVTWCRARGASVVGRGR